VRIGLLLICLTLGAALAGHAVKLTYPAKAGAKVAYRYDVAVKGTLSSPRGVQTTPVEIQARARVVEQVTAVERGLASIQMLIKNGQIIGASGDESVDESLPQSTITFQRTPQGELRHIKDTTAADHAALPGVDNLWQLFARFGHHLRLPEKDVKTGDTWQTQEEIVTKDGRRLVLITDSTLAGSKTVDGKTYLLITSRYRTAAAKAPDGTAPPANTLLVDLNLSGTAQLLFDAQAGEVFRATFAVEMTSEASYYAPGEAEAIPAMRGTFTIRGTAQRTE